MTGGGDAWSAPDNRRRDLGRRLRTGAAGTIAVGGAIFLGAAAGLVTASAHSGSVIGSEDCSGWSVTVSLSHNVSMDRNVDVITTIPGTTGFEDQHFDTSKGTIFTASGTSPVAGTVSLVIDLADDVTQESGPPEAGYSVTLAPPTDCTAAISTTPSQGGVVGTALSDTAQVTGTAGTPTGHVIFALYPPSNPTCSSSGDAPVYTSPVPGALLTKVSKKLSTADSAPYTSAAVGTYHWIAAYTPDTTVYKAVSSPCSAEAVTTTQAAPSIATSASAGGNVPVTVSDSATVSGGVSPTGTVTFTLFPSLAACNAGTGAVAPSMTENLSGRSARSGSITLTVADTYEWRATYNGDANNAAVSSTCGAEPVTAKPGGGGIQGITTPSTGDTGSLTGVTMGGFLLLGGLGVALVGALVPRRRRVG